MGTHDNINGAEPQKEFISGFKGGAISPGKSSQESFEPYTEKNVMEKATNNNKSGLQNNTRPNPYQLTQNSAKNTD